MVEPEMVSSAKHFPIAHSSASSFVFSGTSSNTPGGVRDALTLRRARELMWIVSALSFVGWSPPGAAPPPPPSCPSICRSCASMIARNEVVERGDAKKRGCKSRLIVIEPLSRSSRCVSDGQNL